MLSLLRALVLAVCISIGYAFVQPRFRSAALTASGVQVALPHIVAAAVSSKNAGKCNCSICRGSGAVSCVPCKGSGIDRVNGNVFERWTCSKCKGFGFVTCVCNASKGLTPEQR